MTIRYRRNVRILVENPYVTVSLDEERRFVVYRRTERTFDSIADAEQAFDALVAGLDKLDGTERGLLMDLRDGPARNDPQFEAMVLKYRRLLGARFRRRAVLVKTAAGMLQLRRLERQHGSASVHVDVFLHEHLAIEFLMASPTP